MISLTYVLISGSTKNMKSNAYQGIAIEETIAAMYYVTLKNCKEAKSKWRKKSNSNPMVVRKWCKICELVSVNRYVYSLISCVKNFVVNHVSDIFLQLRLKKKLAFYLLSLLSLVIAKMSTFVFWLIWNQKRRDFRHVPVAVICT